MGNWLQAKVDAAALLHNLQRVREIAPQSSVLAMIKANGYGHGLIETAKIFHSVEALGVARLEEAIVLRQAGINNRIVLMEGFLLAEELAVIADLQLEIVIHQTFQIDMLADLANHHIKTWVKVNTGMNRLGLPPEKLAQSLQRLASCSTIACVMTHFADADQPSLPKTKQQIASFLSLQHSIGHRYALSLANSAAILSLPTAHADWVRPGLMLYGVTPFADLTAAAYNLKPAMQLVAKLIAINNVGKKQTVGYTSRFACPEDMPVGVIAIGYADGYPSVVQDGMPVLLNNRRAAMIGKISMDMATIDLRAHPEAKVGDEVILWGKELPIEQVAKQLGVIPYALLTGVGTRASRVYIKEDVTAKQQMVFL